MTQIKTLLNLCRSYADLGEAITEQLHDMSNNIDPSELNGNAVRHIRGWLKDAREHLDDQGRDEVDYLLEKYSDEALSA